MLIIGDALTELKKMPSESVHCCVTSPPYWGLRDYGVKGQIGLESTPEEYVEKMVEIFREVKRVLRDDGTLWLNLGDSYAGSWGNYAPTGQGGQRPKNTERWQRGAYEGKADWRPPTSNKLEGLKPKDLVGIPWLVAFALRADGWYLRQDIIWHKPNPMPESVTDRCTRAHEYIFLLSKRARYYFDAEAIKEPCVGIEMANGFRGGAYCNNETRDNSKGGKRKARGNIKVPQNWDTEKGTHIAFHRAGRGKTRYKQWDRSMSNGAPNIRERKHADKNGNPYETRNKRSVWTVATTGYPEAHFATYPPQLIEPCILAGCPKGGIVLDPFMGSGTTAEVAIRHQREWIGIELNPAYRDLIEKRLAAVQLKMVEVNS